MEFYIKCDASDNDFINSINSTFQGIETIENHSFGDLFGIVVFFIPAVALSMQTCDFIFNHFTKRSTRVIKIGKDMKEFSFIGFTREEVIKILGELRDDD